MNNKKRSKLVAKQRFAITEERRNEKNKCGKGEKRAKENKKRVENVTK